ncbi:MAG: hypothetical protein FWD48_10625 [Oscillospiraceae bacterium]|nr:hypothetical protein [Oscillospiraceae bacterium]
MEELKPRKILTPRLIVLLSILTVGIVIALYLWTVYLPEMRELLNDFYGQSFEELSLDGDGSAYSPFLIKTAEDLAELAEKVAHGSSYREHYFVLKNDIDLSEFLSESGAGHNDGAGWLPIGLYNGGHFGGIFDGAGHTISGLWLNRPDEIAVGLFGQMRGAEIYRLNIEAVSIIARTNAGVLGGDVRNSRIVNCTATVESFSSSCNQYANALGGLIGDLRSSIIENCSAVLDLEINAEEFTNFGGLIGSAKQGSSIINSHAVVNAVINGNSGVFAGGLVGFIYGASMVTGCYSEGSISAINSLSANIGGLIGEASESGTAIRNSWSSCYVSSAEITGGLIGALSRGAEVSGSRASGTVIINGDSVRTFAGGGFVGWTDGEIDTSYFDGTVIIQKQEEFWAGGFIGVQEGGAVTDCYSTATIFIGVDDPQYHDIGGFAAVQKEDAVITNSYFDGLIINLSGRTRDFIMLQDGVVENCYPHDVDNFDGFDFINVWFMPEGGGAPIFW